MSRWLAIMGSGETTPTMVEVHKALFATLRSARPTTAVVDTPYGFQANADEITARTQQYFAARVGRDVDALSLPRPVDLTSADLARAAATCADVDWLFVGPGSPSYLLRQWNGTALPAAVAGRLDPGPGDRVTVVASAAACTIGVRAIPVYEIYKVGADPHWLDGFDLVSRVGWSCVVIPHYDNAEGGTHDTRYCYLGEPRLTALEAELDAGTWILGVDEHTALLADLGSGEARVVGRGAVTVRAGGASHVLPTGSTTTVAELPAIAARLADGATGGSSAAEAVTDTAPPTVDPPDEPPHDLRTVVDALGSSAQAALADEDVEAVADAVVTLDEALQEWAADPSHSDAADRGHDLLHQLIQQVAGIARRGLHDHRDLVAPLVEELLGLRGRARDERDFATADRIRDALAAAGVEVRDTPEGATWTHREPGREPDRASD